MLAARCATAQTPQLFKLRRHKVPVSAEYPRGTRGAAATRLKGLHGHQTQVVTHKF